MNVKPITKIRRSYSIDIKVAEEFEKICKRKTLNKSAWVEAKMKELIKKEGGK
jgi:hypothetical protein